ncbi:PepSY domain-containing protein [Lacrimispora saccharolytica]|nr:PepSY domain-containing protein [Lacrimispora saccharolytica]
MKRKILVSMITAAFLAVSITACGSSSTDSQSQTGAASQSGGTVVSTNSASGQTADSSAAVTPSVPTQAAASQSGSTSEITEDQAKQIAFDHAQVKEEDLTNLKVKKDFDDGVSIYEVDFQAANKQYEYDIKAADGQILTTDFEIDDDYVDPNTQTAVSEADAKAAALARVEGASDSDIRIQLQRDDGQLVYEGTIIYNNTEYDFEINAETGDFLSWEQDSVYD